MGWLIALVAIGWPSNAPAQDTKTSTATKLPHEGGPLPRAPMPVGGVDDGMKRSGQEGGVPDGGMKRVGQEGTATIGEHCHEHEHGDGTTHSHCHEHITGPEHEHEHPASVVIEDRKDEEIPVPQEPPPSTPSGEKPWQPLGVKTEFGLNLTWDGYIRVIAEVIENDRNSTFIGRNDGFRLADARLGTKVSYEDLYLYLSIEAAVGEAESFNDPNQEFTVRPRDVIIRYDFSQYAGVQVGRFKAPYDIGTLESTEERIFIDAPLESRGVLPTQGNELLGLGQDRELGLMISKDKIGITTDGFDVGYALALTNGRTFNLALNDNDRPAGFARVRLFWGEWVELNLGGFTDTRTVGELPNLFDEDVLGGEVSLVVAFLGLRLEGQFLVQNTEFDTTERPDVLAFGAHGQFDYRLWDFRFGYRFAWYEPNNDDLDDADQIMEHTIAVTYLVPKLPLKFALAGTIPLEQQGRRVDNNRITLLSQFKF
jgi:hypothetical protein